MRLLLLSFALFALTQQQPTWDPPPQPPEAYPGQHEHARPPEDFFCKRQTTALDVPPEQACTCERMFSPDDPNVVLEDRHCTVWCHADKYACGISGGQHANVPILPDPE